MFKKNKDKKSAGKAKKEKPARSKKKREKAPKRENAPKSKNKPQKSKGVDVIPRKMNVYEVMLIISFCCIFLACTFLYLELSRYGSLFRWWPQ